MPKKLKIIPYNPNLKELASELRKKMTLSEVLLWNELKHKRMLGFDFDRQRPINDYIVDFYCKELKLAIEIDGDTHIYRDDEDDERQKKLEELGVHFLRFDDIEVKKSMTNVLRVIEDWIEKNKPTPKPLPGGEPTKKTHPQPLQGGEPEKKDPPLTPPGRGAYRKSQDGNDLQNDHPPPSREGSLRRYYLSSIVQIGSSLSRRLQPRPYPVNDKHQYPGYQRFCCPMYQNN